MPTHRDNAAALLSTLEALLQNISEGGYWTDAQEGWQPILTCVAVEALLDNGLRPEATWHVARLGNRPFTLAQPLAWLNGQIRSDGTVGSDFWDACRLATCIEKHRLHAFFPNYPALQAYVRKSVESKAFRASTSEWEGPGFSALSADYFDLIGEHGIANALEESLRATQRPDGAWYGALGGDGHPLVPPVWHTSQAVLTLARRGRSELRIQIAKALNWIETTQGVDGAWPGTHHFIVYSTCYAILALHRAEQVNRPALDRALQHLLSKMRPDGRCADLGGTLMVALALSSAVNGQIEASLTPMDHVLARCAVNRAVAAEQELVALRARYDESERCRRELETRYDGAEYVFKKPAMFAILIAGFLLSVVSVALTVVPMVVASRSKEESKEPLADTKATEKAPAAAGGAHDAPSGPNSQTMDAPVGLAQPGQQEATPSPGASAKGADESSNNPEPR